MISTYRLQLSKDFTLRDAESIAAYLHELGVSHLYLSPIMEAGKDSGHGYDVVDFDHVSAERGGVEALAALDHAARSFDPSLGLILDIVPNHMGISHDNPFWVDVLRRGRESSFWSLFDLRVEEDEKIRLPVLGAPLEEILERGEIRIEGEWAVYFDRKFPLAPYGGETDPGVILSHQQYMLVPWTDIAQSISYRRFFNITDLIGVRVEDPEVFARAHEGLFALLDALPSVEGVRVDHIDGLALPGPYLDRLADRASRIWVEKILARGEALPENWPIQGTTGYEFIAWLNDVFLDAGNVRALDAWWRERYHVRWDHFQSCVDESKAEVLRDLFGCEVRRLAALSASGEGEEEEAALFWTALSVGMPVYRDYGRGRDLSAADRDVLARAADRDGLLYGDDFTRVARKFMPALLDPLTPRQEQAAREWRQLSGPAMAKGLEDTAHYRYTPLLALNEVGCEATVTPDSASILEWLAERGRTRLASLNATSTHDTKRSEDVRHRLYALADRPQDWFDYVERAEAITGEVRRDGRLPSCFLLQTLIGAWPLDNRIDDNFRKRIQDCLLKSVREARLFTTWAAPDSDYETALRDYIEVVLTQRAFVDLTSRFASRVAFCGAFNSLAALTLKMMAPGIPDLYQGTELWDFSLVDPDNRRPVDFGLRRARLTEIENLEGATLYDRLVAQWRDGGVKLWLTRQLLRVRRDHDLSRLPVLPLAFDGPDAEHLFGFRRGSEREGLAVIVPRHTGALTLDHDGPLRLPALDATVSLGGCRGHSLLTGKACGGALFSALPVEVLYYRR